MNPTDALPTFFIAIASGIVLGVVVLFLVYKIIDRELAVGPGLIALFLIFLAMALAIHPPHPVVPGVVLVSALSLLAFFKFAEERLEEFELRRIDAGRLARSLEAVRVRPDNFAAKLELAKILYSHGFHSHAIELATTTLNELSTERDEVKNRSLREVFSREEALLRRWRSLPASTNAVRCPRCGAYNRPSLLFCSQCGGPYLYDVVEGQEVKPRVWARLVLAWSTIALLIPGCVSIGMNLEGMLRVLCFAGCIIAVGALFAWLFRRPKYSAAYFTG